MNKKAQIKFGETFAIIIVVYIVLVAGMVWYNKVATSNINEMQEQDNKDQAFEKYYYIVNSDLLHKSELTDVDEEFDLISLRVFGNYSKNETNKEFIRKQIGESTILVEVLNKNFSSIENITLYNKTPNEITSQEGFKTLIPIVSPIDNHVYIGKLTVIAYN